MAKQDAALSFQQDRSTRPENELPRVYTIGHSNHTLGTFLHLLTSTGIKAVADVRSFPYSRYVPQFNQKELERALRTQGIKYYFLGDSLGGKPKDQHLLSDSGEPDYRIIAQSSKFKQGLEELLKLASEETVAILCAEEDPDKCHRKLLVAQQLLGRAEVVHIRGNGTIAAEKDSACCIQASLFE